MAKIRIVVLELWSHASEMRSSAPEVLRFATVNAPSKVSYASGFPIELSTIRSLHVRADHSDRFHNLDNFLHSIKAVSLVALSISNGNSIAEQEAEYVTPNTTHLTYPSFDKHEILCNLTSVQPDAHVFRRNFPSAKYLTCQLDMQAVSSRFRGYLTAVLRGDNSEGDDGGHNAKNGIRWPKLDIIAVPLPGKHFYASIVRDMILKAREIGYPIRKLLLPWNTYPREGDEGMEELRKLVEIENFRIHHSIPRGWKE